jgi:hypothetical protein
MTDETKTLIEAVGAAILERLRHLRLIMAAAERGEPGADVWLRRRFNKAIRGVDRMVSELKAVLTGSTAGRGA